MEAQATSCDGYAIKRMREWLRAWERGYSHACCIE